MANKMRHPDGFAVATERRAKVNYGINGTRSYRMQGRRLPGALTFSWRLREMRAKKIGAIILVWCVLTVDIISFFFH